MFYLVLLFLIRSVVEPSERNPGSVTLSSTSGYYAIISAVYRPDICVKDRLMLFHLKSAHSDVCISQMDRLKTWTPSSV